MELKEDNIWAEKVANTQIYLETILQLMGGCCMKQNFNMWIR